MRRTAYLVCLDWSLADDLVQETLAKVFVRWPRIASRGEVEPYVRRVLVTTFLDTRRRPWRRESSAGFPADSQRDRAADAALEAVEGVDDRDRLSAALTRLPERQRAVLVLRFYEDLSVEQTADLLGCTAGNVKSQTARGLTRLREVLDSISTPAGLAGAVSPTSEGDAK